MNKMIRYSFVHSLAVVVYIFLVTNLMSRAEDWLGKMRGILGPTAFLLLFVFSATVVGGLVLGRPILMYLDGDKKKAVRFLFDTIAWLFVWLVLTFIVAALI